MICICDMHVNLERVTYRNKLNIQHVSTNLLSQWHYTFVHQIEMEIAVKLSWLVNICMHWLRGISEWLRPEFRHLNELLYALSLESMKHYSANPFAQVYKLSSIACPLLMLQAPQMHWIQAY